MAVQSCQCAKCKPGAKDYYYLFPPHHLNHCWLLTTGDRGSLLRMDMTTSRASHVAQIIILHFLASVGGVICPPQTERIPASVVPSDSSQILLTPLSSWQFSCLKCQLTAAVWLSPAHHRASCGNSRWCLLKHDLVETSPANWELCKL